MRIPVNKNDVHQGEGYFFLDFIIGPTRMMAHDAAGLGEYYR